MTYEEVKEALDSAKGGLRVYEEQYPHLKEQIKFQKVIINVLEKADKYKWHDLRKDPTDLPDDDRLVDCRTTDKQSAYYGYYISDGDDGEKRNIWIDYEGFSMQVVAWREVELYEEV